MFKAPQNSLKSSWKSEVFKNPKVRGTYTIKKSLGTGKVYFEKSQGKVVSKPFTEHSNLY